MMFLSLDFLYVPSKPPGPVVAYYTDVLGGTLLFRIKEMGTEVAGIKLSETGPRVLLAEHLEGQLPIFIYRVGNLRKAMHEMEDRRWKRGEVSRAQGCSSTSWAASIWRRNTTGPESSGPVGDRSRRVTG